MDKLLGTLWLKVYVRIEGKDRDINNLTTKPNIPHPGATYLK